MHARVRALSGAALALLTCAALAACAGSRGSGLLPAEPGDTPAIAADARTTGTLEIAVRIAAATAPGARYVSPSTRSMHLLLTGGKHPIRRTIELTPSSKGCTTAGKVTTCVDQLALVTGSYAATIYTYDRLKAHGAVLSQGIALPFVIRTGKTKLLKLALDGVPHALSVFGDAGGIHGSQAAGFTLYGGLPLPFGIVATDADGNSIVGAGSPTYKVAVGRGSGWSAAPPTKDSPNTFFVTPSYRNGSTTTVTVTASFRDTTCAQKHAVCTISFSAKNDVQDLFVLSSQGVTEYSTPVATAMPWGINDPNNPVQMAKDAAGNFYVANCVTTCGGASPDSVTIYGPPATVGTAPTTPIATITNGVANPFSIAVSPAGQVFVGNDNGTVSVYSSPFINASVPAFTISANLGGVQALAFDAAGHLFVATCGVSCADVSPDAVYEYASPYTGAPIATITTGIVDPWALAFAPNGSLFVANTGGSGSHFGAYVTTGYAPPFTGYDGGGTPTRVTTPGFPYGLTFDAAGDLFVANCGTGCQVSGAPDDSLLEFAPPYTGAATVIDTSTSSGGVLLRPQAVAIDGFGNLLSANTYDANFTVYAPPYTARTATEFMHDGPTQFILTP